MVSSSLSGVSTASRHDLHAYLTTGPCSGQLPQNIALRLKNSGVAVLGTDPEQIDNAEDRHKFSEILDKVGVDQPEWVEVTSLEAAKDFAARVGYPVLIRPSYVLSGAAMNVVYEPVDLEYNLSKAASVSPRHPVVVTKFIDNAQEIDVDAVAYQGKLLIHAVSEHVENAGTHWGDATLGLPPFSLEEGDMQRLKEVAEKVAAAFEISGPYNMQIIRKPAEDGRPAELKVIECNLRASRSFPFVSKVLGHNFIDVAAAAISGVNVPEPIDAMAQHRDYTAVKVAQFSWTRLGGADPFLGVGEWCRSLALAFAGASLTGACVLQRWRPRARSRASGRTSTRRSGRRCRARRGSSSRARGAACSSAGTSRSRRCAPSRRASSTSASSCTAPRPSSSSF